MALIEIEGISKVFNNEEVETIALQDVSFTIERGEFVSIMGPSGSGKSTLLQILGFLDDPTSGDYRFNGTSWKDYSRDDLARLRNKSMGFVFQSFNLLPRTTVLDNVKLPLWYSSIPESKWDRIAKDVIESVGLSHRSTHVPSQLSGGEKQRAAIARALVVNPEVIFADEPTGNLDTKSGRNIMSILQDLHREQHHTVILITHETDTAKHAQRIITFRDGRIESDKIVKKRNDARKYKK
jgi:putative ABC transport system ATP-binding protein